MKNCSVSGCKSKSGKKGTNVQFFKLPSGTNTGSSFSKQRRAEWLKMITATDVQSQKNIRICAEHFVSGRPAKATAVLHIDWVPSVNVPFRQSTALEDASVERIITNLPEVTEEFDVPEYVTLDEYIFNEKEIESYLVSKYITSPVCDENGYYRNDHDYLGLPIIRVKSPEIDRSNNVRDHNYSIGENPACFYADLSHFCNICRRNNLNLFSFNTHMMLHTLNNDVVCKICKQKFLTTTCLHNHISLHARVCDICGTEVPRVQIKAHQKLNGEQKKAFDAQNGYKITNKQKIHFCIFCMKEIAKKSDYIQHICTQKVVPPLNKQKKECAGSPP